MGIEAKITSRLDYNNVQIEISSRKGENKRFFAVPENKADSFIKNYKKLDKKNSLVANSAFMGGIFAGILAASTATRKIKHTALRWGLNLAGGIIGAGASIVGTSKYMLNQQDKLLAANQAKELIY